MAKRNTSPISRAVRSAARALIVDNGRLLTVRMRRPGESEDFLVLPGGGQNHGETLVETLKRECSEELGVVPEIHEVAYIREYIGKNHTFARQHSNFHQLEIVFRCSLPQGATPHVGDEHDKHQIGLSWIPLSELANHNVYPQVLTSYIDGTRIAVSPLYLGDIN